MNEDQYLIFDQYLQNELNDAEKANFESQLISDTEMAKSFEIYKYLNIFLVNKFQNETALDSFKENLKLAAKSKNKKTKIISIKPMYYAIAACFTLVFGLMMFKNSGSVNYQDYRQFENAHFIERGDFIEDLKMAQEAYNAKDFANAAVLFKKVLKNYPKPEIEFFYAISLFESDNEVEAETIFLKLSQGKSLYNTKALWNLALLKLKQKDLEACKNILKKIPTDFENYDKVEKLLYKLD